MVRIVFNLRLSKNNCNHKIIFTLFSFTIHDVSACMIVQHDNLGFFSFSSYYVFLTITLWQVDYGDVICNKSVWEQKPYSILCKWKYVGHLDKFRLCHVMPFSEKIIVISYYKIWTREPKTREISTFFGHVYIWQWQNGSHNCFQS